MFFDFVSSPPLLCLPFFFFYFFSYSSFSISSLLLRLFLLFLFFLLFFFCFFSSWFSFSHFFHFPYMITGGFPGTGMELWIKECVTLPTDLSRWLVYCKMLWNDKVAISCCLETTTSCFIVQYSASRCLSCQMEMPDFSTMLNDCLIFSKESRVKGLLQRIVWRVNNKTFVHLPDYNGLLYLKYKIIFSHSIMILPTFILFLLFTGENQKHVLVLRERNKTKKKNKN